jgi:hypothetical protein
MFLEDEKKNVPLVLGGLNCSPPVRVWLVTSRLGDGKIANLFYSVVYVICAFLCHFSSKLYALTTTS